MDTNQEPRFYASPLKWDRDYEEYTSTGKDLKLGDQTILGWDTYNEFLAFMDSLSTEEKCALGEWSLTDDITDHSIHITDGIFDEVSFLSLALKH